MKILSAEASYTETAGADDFSVARLWRAYVASLKVAAGKRALRRELAGMDETLLRDIGIAEDEIWRIRHNNSFVPRAWE